MKLLTKEIEGRMPPLRSTDGMPLDEKIIHVKFFDPAGHGYWLIAEGEWVGEPDERDYLMFGFAEIFPGCGEWGYVSLNEMQSVTGQFGLGIERDLHHKPIPFSKFDGRYATA